MNAITYESPVGTLTLTADEEGLRGLWLEGQKYFAAGMPEALEAPEPGTPSAKTLSDAKAWLDAYFAGERPDPAALTLAPIGSPFRQLVWQELLRIPYGETLTYGEIGQRVAQIQGRPTSSLAVGGAVGHNPISIIIPCHRVLGANRNLTGYAGGLDRKTWLLDHEGIAPETLRRPKKGTAL